METARGVLRGHGELRPFFEKLAQRKPGARRHHRVGYLTDGRTEVMEIDGGLIRRHRVYWGWFGVRVLQTDAYRR
jgi:hypothetical protein